MQEYYIRNPDSEESRGPFTVDQLTSLGETGHVTLETYIYNVEAEQWEVLESNEALRATIFPEKRRLMMKPKATFESLNQGEAEIAPVTIDDLLAAAEGNTEDTKHRKKAGVWREKAATLAMYLSGTAFVLGAVAFLFLQRQTLIAFDVMTVLSSPLIVVALVDLALAFILFLQSAAIYPLIRFRTMLGAGFFLFYFWAVEQPLMGVVTAIASLGIYGLTLFLDKVPFLISAGLAVLGMLALLILSLGV